MIDTAFEEKFGRFMPMPFLVVNSNGKIVRFNERIKEVFPFDAVTVGGKSAAEIGELVTSIDGSSTDSEYPSAKCLYTIVYGN